MITVVTVFRQRTNCRQDVTHLKQNDETIELNEACFFSTVLNKVNYHTEFQALVYHMFQLYKWFVSFAVTCKEFFNLQLRSDQNMSRTNQGQRKHRKNLSNPNKRKQFSLSCHVDPWFAQVGWYTTNILFACPARSNKISMLCVFKLLFWWVIVVFDFCVCCWYVFMYCEPLNHPFC